jgi:alkanesulfonate monooxygenase SsuD/methylene tetrahydromethanopterin reductase-like flavin-dependent oxidoreductase (luciferase family)
MRIGVVFPQTELGGDPVVVRAYGQRVEELGFTHILAYDHLVGADPKVHQGWQGPYDIDSTFHEPFVMFGYLAAVTSLELVTGIIILPQRQSVLVAKQAAEGWFPMFGPGRRLDYATEHVKRAAVAAGRDADSLGMEGRVSWTGDRDKAAAEIAAWKAAGVTHLNVNTMDAGLATVDDHLAVLERVATDLVR